jgi:hypothetical protein
MIEHPAKPEIDHRTIKLIVGVVALSLAPLTDVLSGGGLASISAAYYAGGWAQEILIGFLFAIAAFLLAYNGRERLEMIMSKVASFSALGIALFPCECTRPGTVSVVHALAAAVMFLVLAWFCYTFYRRARGKGRGRPRARSTIYAICGIAMLISIVALSANLALQGSLAGRFPDFVFWGEATALVAFGFSWLTASHTLPLINEPAERYSPLRERNPESPSLEE